MTRNWWIDNLRSFITLLVVAHHSTLAYTTFAWFNKDAYILSTHPVVDTARSVWLDVFEDFNDIFFMQLMFLISGIFVVQSLQNKSVATFIRDRFYRLFIPFIIGVTVLMLLAYYPAYLLAHGTHDVKAYIIDFFTVEAWPVGPPWFIWVLFIFNLVFALCYPLIKNSINKLTLHNPHPVKFFTGWFVFSWVLYVPVIMIIDPYIWTGIGPFDFQVSRALMYFGYFLLGVLIGAQGLNKGLFAEGTAVVKRWPVWLIACLCAYTLLKLSEAPLRSMIDQQQLSLFTANVIYRSEWILSCTLSCIAFLTTFKSMVHAKNSWWRSLSANAYGIYLVHYIFVIWGQYVLLPYDLPALAKALITFVAAVILSWLLTAMVRKIPIVKKYL